MSFIVRTTHKGAQFWLRRTTWAFHADRAEHFPTREAAQGALDKSKQFNAAAAYKAAVIEEVE
jgi:hypothetical protein